MTGRRSFSTLTASFPPERRARLEDRKSALRLEMALAQVRQAMGVSQEELARRLSVRQPAVAKLEQREDARIGTIRSYVEALGGEVDIVARFGDSHVVITTLGTAQKTAVGAA